MTSASRASSTSTVISLSVGLQSQGVIQPCCCFAFHAMYLFIFVEGLLVVSCCCIIFAQIGKKYHLPGGSFCSFHDHIKTDKYTIERLSSLAASPATIAGLKAMRAAPEVGGQEELTKSGTERCRFVGDIFWGGCLNAPTQPPTHTLVHSVLGPPSLPCSQSTSQVNYMPHCHYTTTILMSL